jgi:hypothetical protein
MPGTKPGKPRLRKMIRAAEASPRLGTVAPNLTGNAD